MSKLKIIVVGSGIGGSAAALFLSRLPVQVTILESRPTRSASLAGAILNFSPNGMCVIAGLGLADTIIQRDNGIEVPAISMYDSSGSFLGKVPHGSKERYGYPSLMTTRWDIHEVLLEDAENRGIEVRYGAKVRALQELEDGVLVQWSENGEDKESKVDLVIGADGIWSVVRQSVYDHIKSPCPQPTYNGLVGIGGMLKVASVPNLDKFLNHDKPVVMVHGRNGFFGITLYDSKAEHVGWWSTHEAPEKAKGEWQTPKEQTLSEVKRRHSDWAFPVSQIVAAAETDGFEPMVWPSYEVDNLKYWHTNRMVLIGDAAHATPPHAGQGASQALEDAAYLAHLLRQLLSSTKPGVLTAMELHSVLSAFQEARQKRVNEIIAEANKRGDGKRELSAIGMFIKKWSMKVFLTFIMKESWLDGWFGYKVPGIHEWS